HDHFVERLSLLTLAQHADHAYCRSSAQPQDGQCDELVSYAKFHTVLLERKLTAEPNDHCIADCTIDVLGDILNVGLNGKVLIDLCAIRKLDDHLILRARTAGCDHSLLIRAANMRGRDPEP